MFLPFSRANAKGEQGFTLVELLVVILIIGILAAVAIPAFLGQRQRANDAAVESDVKNVSIAAETWMTGNPNERFPFDSGWKRNEITVGTGNDAITVDLSEGVSMVLRHPRDHHTGTNVFQPDETVPDGVFEIEAVHDNGKQYPYEGNRLRYRSDKGGFY